MLTTGERASAIVLPTMQHNKQSSRGPKHYISEWASFRGLRQRDLVASGDFEKSIVSKWFNKGALPTDDNLSKLADILGITKPDLFRPPFEDEQALSSISTTARQSDQDLSRIPDLAIHGGMGNGGFLSVKLDDAGGLENPDDVRGFWTFPDYMLRQLGNLKSIYAWEARGDSMDPTLPGGSVVFVDTHQTALPPEDIYALNYGDGLMVKRLKLVPRSEFIDVISDNERYGSDRLRREEVEIYGRVVGWFQWRG